MTEYSPEVVSIFDGNGRRLARLPDAVGDRWYRTMQVGRGSYSIPQTDRNLELCDPTSGNLLVVESELYPLVWAGPIVRLAGRSATGEVRIEARSYEWILQRRFLPAGYAVNGTAGELFEDFLRRVESDNATRVALGSVAGGAYFPETSFAERSLFAAWSTLAQQTGNEWWLEHSVARDSLSVTAHFRPARGQDRQLEVRLVDGPRGSVNVNEWAIDIEAAPHLIRAVAGASSSTEGFSDRTRATRQGSASAPVRGAVVATTPRTRHGAQFERWPTGDSVVTRSEQYAVLENVRGSGPLATAAEALLLRGRVAQRPLDLEVTGYGDLWANITPGDLIGLELPEPYFIDGYAGPVAVISTQPLERVGRFGLTVEVPQL